VLGRPVRIDTEAIQAPAFDYVALPAEWIPTPPPGGRRMGAPRSDCAIGAIPSEVLAILRADRIFDVDELARIRSTVGIKVAHHQGAISPLLRETYAAANRCVVDISISRCLFGRGGCCVVHCRDWCCRDWCEFCSVGLSFTGGVSCGLGR